VSRGIESPTQQLPQSSGIYSTPTQHIMGIRKGLANALISTAAMLESDKSKEYISTKLNEYRIRAAALMMPNDMAFIITPKTEV
jgi:hypothetical protein